LRKLIVARQNSSIPVKREAHPVGRAALIANDIWLVARTRYGDLRDTFHLSRLTRNDLRMLADFFSSLLETQETVVYNA
jgi:hypothetical protein